MPRRERHELRRDARAPHRVRRPGARGGARRLGWVFGAAGLLAAARMEAGYVGTRAATPGGEGAEFCRVSMSPVPGDAQTAPQPMLHCTCLEDVALFFNTDQLYDQAVMWRGPDRPSAGMFAEYFETPEGRAGAVCQLYVFLTDVGGGASGSVDVFVWADESGRPGEVLGTLPDIDVGRVAQYPGFGIEVLEVYEREQIGVQGGFWVGFRGNWSAEDCGILLVVDTLDENPGQPAARRTAMTHSDGPAGEWQSFEDLLGVPAATGILAYVGWCPVPVLATSWGQVKSLFGEAP